LNTLLFLDCFAIEETAGETIFQTLNHLYLEKTGVRKSKFISTPKVSTAKTKKKFSFQLTLLPHQIFIMPQDYELYLNEPNTNILENFKKYNDSELR
jgi:hypothetical protein